MANKNNGNKEFLPESPDSDVPLFVKLKRLLRTQMLTGHFKDGQRLPSEHELCAAHGVSRITVQRAMQDLLAEGLLVRKQGKGTFVNIQRTNEQKNMVGILHFGELPESQMVTRILDGANEAAAQAGFKVVMISSDIRIETPLEPAMALNEAKTIGTLLMSPVGPQEAPAMARLIHALKATNQHIVTVDTRMEDPESQSISYVTSRNRDGAYEMTKHLLSLGYKRLSFLAISSSDSAVKRKAGFLDALEEAGIEPRPEYMLKVAADEILQQGIQELDVFMAMREPPEAIFCTHDRIAANVIEAARARGLKVPGDFAVVGFDDLPETIDICPNLTTIHQEFFKIGSRAMEVLLGHIRGEITKPITERIPCRLVVRESCGAKLKG